MTGLMAGLNKTNKFGTFFRETKFFHLCHNISKGYMGKIYTKEDFWYIHELPGWFL